MEQSKPTLAITQDMFLNSLMKPMPGTKIRAFFDEFSWVRSYVHPHQVNQVYVSRIDPNVISRQLSGEMEDVGFESERLVPSYDEHAYLLDDNFKVVTREISVQDEPYRKYVFWGPMVTPPAREEVIKGIVTYPPIEFRTYLSILKGKQHVLRRFSQSLGILLAFSLCINHRRESR